MNDPVLVVGAGPVGLTMAMTLKRLGVDVRIVDKAPAATDKSKALVLWPRTLELLDIQGCVQPFLDTGMQAVGARILAEGKSLVHLQFDAARTVYPFALMIPQNDTERLLDERLEQLGVKVERKVELTGCVDDGRGVTALLLHPDGHDESFRTSYVIGCDGAHSTVRHALAAEFGGSTLPSYWLLADLQLDGDIPRDEITICWTPQGVLVFFPISKSRFRVIADVGTVLESASAPLLSDVQRVLDARGPPALLAHDPVWISHFRINERKVIHYAKGRIYLVGDAAHIHSPAGGQGMNTGMQDAFNLAWKLSMTWHGQASSALLNSYSPERSAIGDAVLRNAGNMTALAILRNPILQDIRSLALGALGHIAGLRQKLVDQLMELDLNYRDSALSSSPHGAGRHPAGGDRAPDMPLTTLSGQSRLHELLSSGRFAVVAVGAGMPQLPASLRNIAVAAAAESAMDYESGHVYLIRPDAYVMMNTRPDDIAPIVVALERIRTG